MTKAACEFVTPLTFREITGLPVHTEMFTPPVQWRTALSPWPEKPTWWR